MNRVCITQNVTNIYLSTAQCAVITYHAQNFSWFSFKKPNASVHMLHTESSVAKLLKPSGNIAVMMRHTTALLTVQLVHPDGPESAAIPPL